MTDHADTIRRAEKIIASPSHSNVAKALARGTLALVAERQQAIDERDAERRDADFRERGLHEALRKETARCEQAIDALRAIEPIQQQVLAGFQKHGIVFDRAPSVNPDPSDWQQVAFSIYTSLCEVDSIVAAALLNLGEQQ